MSRSLRRADIKELLCQEYIDPEIDPEIHMYVSVVSDIIDKAFPDLCILDEDSLSVDEIAAIHASNGDTIIELLDDWVVTHLVSICDDILAISLTSEMSFAICIAGKDEEKLFTWLSKE